MPTALALVVVLSLSRAPMPGDLIWQSGEQLSKGTQRTFVAVGTKKGTRYVFRAQGQCWWIPLRIPTKTGFIERERTERIFGIDFRVTFGSDTKQFLNVGERVPQQSELTFVADRDDVPISIVDAFELPRDVMCNVEGLQVLQAAQQP